MVFTVGDELIQKSKIKTNSTGFTLIEMLAVTGIIIFLTILIVPNYRFGDRQLALQRSAHKLVQDLRKTQEMAMSAEEFQGQVFPRYGIEFGRARDYYILFADMNDNGTRQSPDIEVERIFFERRVTIQNLLTPSSQETVWVAFKPPDPFTTIMDSGERSVLRIQLTNADNQIKTISVNNVGLISVE